MPKYRVTVTNLRERKRIVVKAADPHKAAKAARQWARDNGMDTGRLGIGDVHPSRKGD